MRLRALNSESIRHLLCVYRSGYHRVINSQLHAFAESNPAYCCVTAHDLKDKGDALHFSTASQRRLGLRFACAHVDTVMRLSCSESNREFMDTEYL